METTRLGRTGLRVSVAGLGSGGHSRLGRATGRSREESLAVVRHAIDGGVNFIDTAFAYGTEAIVGQAIRESGEAVIVSTKCSPTRNGELVRGEDVLGFCEASLRRLGLEAIDVYILHGVLPSEYEHAREELVPALVKLREQGKVRFCGLTERFNADPAHAMLARALDDDFFDVVMVGYNLLNPSAKRTVFPRTVAADVGTQIMFAVRRALAHPEVIAKVVAELVERGEVDGSVCDPSAPLDFLLAEASSTVEAAYRFCRHTQGADVVLTGTGDRAHLESNLDAIQGPALSSESLERLERCFGGVDSVTGN